MTISFFLNKTCYSGGLDKWPYCLTVSSHVILFVCQSDLSSQTLSFLDHHWPPPNKLCHPQSTSNWPTWSNIAGYQTYKIYCLHGIDLLSHVLRKGPDFSFIRICEWRRGMCASCYKTIAGTIKRRVMIMVWYRSCQYKTETNISLPLGFFLSPNGVERCEVNCLPLSENNPWISSVLAYGLLCVLQGGEIHTKTEGHCWFHAFLLLEIHSLTGWLEFPFTSSGFCLLYMLIPLVLYP